MAEIKQVNGRSVVDYMARDYQSLLQAMYDLIPSRLPEWQDFTNQADFGNVLLELFAHMGDILSYYQDRVANESFLGTAQTRRSIIQHLALIGYKLATAAPAAASLSLSVAGNVTAAVTINRGDAFATKSTKTRPSVRFEYTGDMPLVIDFSNLADPRITTTKDANGKITRRFFSPVLVEEGRLFKDEVLGVSDGTPDQRFTLAHTPLILRSLGQATLVNKDIALITDLAGVINVWTLQESLAFSRESQRDYVVEIDEEDRAVVVFGDSAFGAIPPAGATIRATYRTGGGLLGNVGANTIQTIVAAPQLALIGAKVTNPSPATGGADRESIEHAALLAPAVFRSLRRAVTAEDYRALALRYKGVGKVRAEATNWNTVTLYVAPEGGGQVSDVLEANLLAYFEDKRPLSTLIEIADVDYVPIYVTAQVGVTSYYSREAVAAQVQAAAGSLLSFDNVDFAQPIYLSKFYEKIEALDGVDYVNITEFCRDSPCPGAVEVSGKLTLSSNEIPVIPDNTEYAAGIKVSATGGY